MVPTVEITEDGGEFELKTITTFKTTTIKFKLGEPFEEETADGRKVTVGVRGPVRTGSSALQAGAATQSLHYARGRDAKFIMTGAGMQSRGLKGNILPGAAVGAAVTRHLKTEPEPESEPEPEWILTETAIVAVKSKVAPAPK